MIRNSLTQKHEQLTETEQAVYSIYKEDLKEIFNLILIENSGSFLNNLSKRIKLSIAKQFNDFPQESIAKIEGLIQNQIYPLEYKTAYTAMSVIKRKQEGSKGVKSFKGSFVLHSCPNRDNSLYHTCGKRFYNYKCKPDSERSVSLFLCTYCDMVYKSDLIKAHCLLCKEDFYTKLISEPNDGDDLPTNRLPLATWKQYHCNFLYNQRMKCLTCARELRFMERTGLVRCEKCKYEIKSKGFMYNCVKCNKPFSSDAKAYNNFDQKHIDIAIKDALVKKTKARPDILNCFCSVCKEDIDIKRTKFWHHQNNCNGEMINGEFDNKKIVICSKCEAVYYHEEFKWKCSSCSNNTKSISSIPKRKPLPKQMPMSISIQVEIQRSNGKDKHKEEEEQEFAPTDYRHSVKNSFGNTPTRHSDSKNIGHISIPLSKRNSNCQLMKKIQLISNNNLPNYSALKCNLAKRFSCYNITNLEEKMKSNLEESHIKTKSSSLHSNSTSCSIQPIEQNDDIGGLIDKFNIEDYKIIKQIGEGSFGKIFLVETKLKQQFALKKILASNEKEIMNLRHEYNVLMSLQKASNTHALITIYGIQSSQLDPTTYIMYVLMELGSIDWEKEIENRSKKREYYTEEELIKLSYSLVSTFAQIQRNNISHRDIKPQNILLCSNAKGKVQYKIADFGEAKEFNQINQQRVELQTLRGTELYMSPILFQALRSKTKSVETETYKYIKYNAYKSDVFSLGLCVLYAAVLSYSALYDIRELADMISVKMVLNKYLKRNYSEKMIDLMMLMLEIDEDTRCDFVALERRYEQLYSKVLGI